MINMSVLDEDVVDVASLTVENEMLKQKLTNVNKQLHSLIEYYDGMMFAQKYSLNTSTQQSRAEMLNELYEMFYGDTPLCDTCFGYDGFFLIIDKIYEYLTDHKLLVKILKKILK